MPIKRVIVNASLLNLSREERADRSATGYLWHIEKVKALLGFRVIGREII